VQAARVLDHIRFTRHNRASLKTIYKVAAMSRIVLRTLTSRTAMNIVNILLILLLIQGVYEVLVSVPQVSILQHRMEDILEGLGTILVALGVALEERETLLRFFGVYPADLTPMQSRIDHHCHGYGLLLLLVGLFIEVAVYAIRMPNLEAIDFDPALLLIGAVLCAVGAVLLARLSWLIWRAPHEVTHP